MLKFSPKFLLSEQLGLTLSQVENSLKKGDFSRYMVLLLSDPAGKIECIPTLSFSQQYYRNKDYLIFGVAATEREAGEMLTDLYGSCYDLTGTIDILTFLFQEE